MTTTELLLRGRVKVLEGLGVLLGSSGSLCVSNCLVFIHSNLDRVIVKYTDKEWGQNILCTLNYINKEENTQTNKQTNNKVIHLYRWCRFSICCRSDCKSDLGLSCPTHVTCPGSLSPVQPYPAGGSVTGRHRSTKGCLALRGPLQNFSLTLQTGDAGGFVW